VTVGSAAAAAYIVAALLFILALAGLSRHETARFGNTFGIAGMAIALVATLVLAISGGFTALQVGLERTDVRLTTGGARPLPADGTQRPPRPV